MSSSFLLLTIVQKQPCTHKSKVNSGEYKVATNTFLFILYVKGTALIIHF